MSITSINPANNQPIQTYTKHTAEEAQRIVHNAYEAYKHWRGVPVAERVEYLEKVEKIIKKNRDKYAKIISLEMGKPLAEAKAEVDKCALAAHYFATHSEGFLKDQPIATEYRASYISFQPLGVILGVMPWNFPFWQVLRYAYPALAAGNTCVLKHASNTPGCALAIEEIFKEAGLPEHCFNTVLISGSEVEPLIANPKIAAVTLTGSTPAGSAVASQAGKHLKKTVLELGGSDPYIILEDADLDHAVKTIGNGRMLNCGQSCVSPKRMIVHEKIVPQFEKALKKLFESAVMGDPFHSDTTIGPMSRTDLRDELHEQVTRSVDAGATLLTGGIIPDKTGAFYPPTILTNVKKGMPAYEEEMFGPVAVIIPVKDDAQAIKVANDSEFGLGGAIFTKNLEKGERLARDKVQSGACFVNMALRSDPRLPFGGIKKSGYGRELSVFGQLEFVNIKTVVVA